MKSFAELFKKYRLRAEFETFSSFGDALSEKGYYYDDSIFSHWQKGTRTPRDRKLLLKVLEIFVERESIKILDQANEFLSSAGLGYLTEKEKNIYFTNLFHAPFQVPNEIAYFTGRKNILQKVDKFLKSGTVILLQGPPGVGKTAMAIKLGHTLRSKYPDGVLWYKVDSSNSMDILLSIARLFGEDISNIKNIEVRASIVRTLLSKKKVLLIFDNVTAKDELNLLIPNSESCCVVISSKERTLNLDTNYISLSISAFTDEEVLELFTNVFNEAYISKNKKEIIKVCNQLGYLPLGVHVAALYMKQFSLSPKEYLQQISEPNFHLQKLSYEDRNLFKAITLSFDTLTVQAKNIFISLGVFEGKDFSLEAVSYINKISLTQTELHLQNLLQISFIEQSKAKRYRIHPLLKLFARGKIKDESLYLSAALYYEMLLHSVQEKKSYKQLRQEADNIVYVLNKCYQLGYWDEIITLWNPIEVFLSNINETKKLHKLAQTIDTTSSVDKLQKVITLCMGFLLLFGLIIYLSGSKTSVWNYTYGVLWNVIPLVGGFVGIIRSWFFGSFRTNIGKAKFFISAGLFVWACGNLVWQYYNVFEKIDVPYPSFADAGYLSAAVLWIIGMIYLSRATGAKLVFRENRKKLTFLIIPLMIAVVLYYFLLFIVKRPSSSDTPLKIFLDLVYPSMDIIILTIALVIFGLSLNFFRGKYKLSLFAIVGGFVGLFVSDLMFSYFTTLGIYYNGSLLEVFFSLAFYFLTWGILSFYLTKKKTNI